MNKLINIKGLNINYNIAGNSINTIVLLHGFLEDLSIWDDLSSSLSKSYKIIAIDLPGFGKSGMLGDIHSMNLMAETVNHILEFEKINKCFIVGHSMGGYVSLAFAELFPKKISGLVLFHSQASADDEKAKKIRNKTIEIIKKNHSKFISSFIPTLFAEQNITRYKDEIDILTKVSLKTKDEGIIAALYGMRDRKDYLKLLSELQIPVLFIVGKQDSKIPLEKINPQITLPKISEVLFLDNVGHMGFIEAKDITFATLRGFIDKYCN